MASRNSSMLVIGLLAAFYPTAALAQGRGWRWFQTCPTPTNIVLEARLDSASVFRTTFPVCLIEKAPWSKRAVRFHFTPGRAIEWPYASVWRDGDRRQLTPTTSAGHPLVAHMYEQGTDTSGSILQITITSKDSLTPLDTMLGMASHKASPADRVATELVPGLVITTYPVGWQPRPQPRDTTWCARPRRNEPLLLDAQFLPARGANRTGPDSQFINLLSITHLIGIKKVPKDSIAIISDEQTCRRIAKDYGARIRRELPDWVDASVLIIRVGQFYLVDDQRSRDGASPIWEVAVYNHKWERQISYGEGQ